MKKIYILGMIMALMCAVCACNDEDGVVPSKISGLIAEPCEGGVILRWDVPVDSGYVYVKVEYQNRQTGEMIKKNVSVYQDSLLVDGLLAKDGEYTFNLTSMSRTETPGEVNTISATALPVQPTIKKQTEEIKLSVENVSTNAQEPSQGPIEDLVDGNLKNFFHTAWSTPAPGPHYIDIASPKPVGQFEITTWYRSGSYGQTPKDITVLGSNDGTNWSEISQIINDGSAGGAFYTTPVLGKEDEEYTHIRYQADTTSDGQTYFSMAELKLYKVWYDIYDPEGIYKPEN